MILSALSCGVGAAPSGKGLTFTLGAGPQPGADQDHSSIGLDYNFYRWKLGPKRELLLGASYTAIKAKLDSGDSDNISGLSIYPQLNFYADSRAWGTPFLFARALGPSYLNQKTLGERQQEHFSFQAQMGAGIYLPQQAGSISISWKHFSNANFGNNNDGIDIPLVLSLGWHF